MVRVYSAGNPVDAHLARGLLEAGGIWAIVQGELLGAARGELPLTPETTPSVWVVDDADAATAVELIRQEGRGARPACCPACGYDLRG